ncbi:hypothetical protein DOTSEDRAFT_74350 [Dothistroma septosporum NZE10]|uniref:ATP-grasp domain-containing protein n=1 Tax=Dothistroma septosporum (strain NZE10 / CBS 128990) TaxID=675120 RepID=N1PHJ9_DOTSN|nr:hypothetical protein DOTSEDRAFT_74350 [Dothistroma septosporum NZE10]
MATIKYPQVKLDWTLSDLYSLDGGDPNKVALVLSGPIPFAPVSKSLPANTKYVYQSPGAPDLGKDVYARVSLGNGTQNHYFAAGPINVHLFDIDHPRYDEENNCVESPPSHHTDAMRTFAALVPEQRPRLNFIAKHDEFQLAPGVSVNPYPPMDFLDAHPCVVDQEVHYGLMSKRDLALSHLSTPATRVIDSTLAAKDKHDTIKVEAEVQRFVQAVRDEPLPFVIKLPQSATGQGVWVVKHESERQTRLTTVENAVIAMINDLNPSNEHLHVVSLLIQQLVDGRTNNMSVFITATGRPVFLSCCEQILDENGVWKASTINYTRQQELEAEFQNITKEVAAHVYEQGFTGAMGFDVMTNAEGKQLVVDMNIRITGDVFMGPLKSHYEQRGMEHSYLMSPLAFAGDRDAFETLFSDEIQSGQLIILGWCRGKVRQIGATYSICSVSVGGKDMTDMLTLGDRIYAAMLPRPV